MEELGFDISFAAFEKMGDLGGRVVLVVSQDEYHPLPGRAFIQEMVDLVYDLAVKRYIFRKGVGIRGSSPL